MIDGTADEGRVKIEITAPGANYVTVTRQHPSGRIVTVRGMDLATLSGGQFVGWDYEAPVNIPVIYVATSYIDSTTIVDVSDPITVTWSTPFEWLKDPLNPPRNMTVHIGDMSAYAYQTPSGVHPILGRPEPIVVNEVRQAATGDVTIVTLTQQERDQLHYITSSGNTLLLQSTQESGVGSMYIAPLNLQETRNANIRDEDSRSWTLSYQEVSSPVGDAAPFTTWNDVLANYSDWQTIKDTYESWLIFEESVSQSGPTPPILAWRGG